jgi:formiminoglutamase
MSNNQFKWQGRIDDEDGTSGLRWHQQVTYKPSSNAFALCGFCCDLGVKANKGRVGAKQGPDTIRESLGNFASHTDLPLFDRGNIVAEGDLKFAQEAYANQITELINNHPFVVGLGGGHEIAWGSYLGLANTSTEKKIGIINFDAHFDLRKENPSASSGTPFRQIAAHCKEHNKHFHYACIGISEAANTKALFDYAHQQNVKYLCDYESEFDAVKTLLSPMLKEVDQIYLTICLDAFPSDIAPGVSAPSSLGIEPTMVIKALKWIAKSQNTFNFEWRLADIAEMNPTYDIDNRTSKLAARLVFEMVNAKSYTL